MKKLTRLIFIIAISCLSLFSTASVLCSPQDISCSEDKKCESTLSSADDYAKAIATALEKSPSHIEDYVEADRLFDEAREKNMLNANVYAEYMTSPLRGNSEKIFELFDEAKSKGMLNGAIYGKTMFVAFRIKDNGKNAKGIALLDEAGKAKDMLDAGFYEWCIQSMPYVEAPGFNNYHYAASLIFGDAKKANMLSTGVYSSFMTLLMEAKEYQRVLELFYEAREKNMLDRWIYVCAIDAISVSSTSETDSCERVIELRREAEEKGMLYDYDIDDFKTLCTDT